MIGLAYVGTANNQALRKLLHCILKNYFIFLIKNNLDASADVSDDVRRASVISIAFLMLNNPEQVLYNL